MKHLLSIFCISLVIGVGCGNKEDDEVLIKDLLEISQYSAATAVQDDGSSTPKDAFPGLTDSIMPFVRFARAIQRPVTRNINVVVTGDSATATIKAELTGTIYVLDSIGGLVYERPIQDSFARQVKLYKDTIWHVVSITAGDFRTVGAPVSITITELKAEVARRGYTWRLTSPAEFLTRAQLPAFEPRDTVVVTVTVTTTGDSTWSFLHHGRRNDATGTGVHIRDPFYKVSTHVFRRTWVIATDNILPGDLPAVRHAAVDAIGWPTLWGRSNGTYYCRAWALPYIVKNPGQPDPEDQ